MFNVVRNERGGMIVIMAFAVVVMTVCGLTAYYLAGTELSASGTKFEKAKALYLAEGGLQRAITEMSSGLNDGWGDEIAGIDGTMGTDDDGILSFGPQVDCSAFKGELVTDCNDVNETSYWDNYLGHYDVKVSDARPLEQQIGSTNKVILQSTGVSSKNVKRRIEAEIEIFDLPMPPSLVFMVGRYNETVFPDPFFAGQSWLVDGKDTATDLTLTGQPSVPGIASNGPAQPIMDELHDNQKDQVFGSGYDDSVSPPIPSVAQDGMMVNLTETAQKLKGMADNLVPPGTYSTFTGYGSPDDYQITVCDGDLHLSGLIEGYGVLVVTGDLIMSGQGKWEGYIICLNHARFTGGGNTFHLFGTLMIGNSSGLDYTAEFEITGNADLYFNIGNIEHARNDVRTVQINYWRSVAAR
jgi:Tfp pilus assembly protein PilX